MMSIVEGNVSNDEVPPNTGTNPESNKDQVDDSINMSTMNERQKRMFQIKLKMNQGRKANKVEVENEYRRMTDPKFAKKKYYENKYDKSSQRGNADIEAVMDDDIHKKPSKEEELLNISAIDSQRRQEKRDEKERSKSTFGWQAFTSEATFRGYEKSLKHMPTRGEDDDVARHGTSTSEAILTLEDKLLTNQRGGTSVSQAALERLGKRIEDREKEKEKFSRRRMHVDAGDVDYINDDNAKFNKRIKRSFNKYTVEIRQNLERGTAV